MQQNVSTKTPSLINANSNWMFTLTILGGCTQHLMFKIISFYGNDEPFVGHVSNLLAWIGENFTANETRDAFENSLWKDVCRPIRYCSS